MSLADAIVARAAGRERVEPGEIVWCDVDAAMLHDSAGPRRIAAALERLGGRVWDPDAVVVVSDHFVPAANDAAARILALTREWAAAQGIARYHEGEGISHTLMVERAYVAPGMLYVGGDSHSCTAGVLGCLALGVGSTDMLGVLATGRLWCEVPETLAVELRGAPAPGATAKDVVLTMLADPRRREARNRVVELGGEGLERLGVPERSVLTNMCSELGAVTGVVPADAVTEDWLRERGAECPEPPAGAGEGAAASWEVDMDAVVPMIARPHTVEDVVPAADLCGVAVSRCYIGACTGAKHTDLAMAAELLRGRRVAPGVQLHVAPASREAVAAAAGDGVLATLVEAGAQLQASGCGACLGYGNGVLGAGDVCISTTNRNFRGRMGSPDAEVYLGSPYAVAAAAVAGEIVDPRPMLAASR